MEISLQFSTEQEELVVCIRAQSSELTLARQQPKETVPFVFSTFRKISTSSSSSKKDSRRATSDQYVAEGRILSQRQQMFHVSRKTVRPNKLIDLE